MEFLNENNQNSPNFLPTKNYHHSQVSEKDLATLNHGVDKSTTLTLSPNSYLSNGGPSPETAIRNSPLMNRSVPWKTERDELKSLKLEKLLGNEGPKRGESIVDNEFELGMKELDSPPLPQPPLSLAVSLNKGQKYSGGSRGLGMKNGGATVKNKSGIAGGDSSMISSSLATSEKVLTMGTKK